MPTADDENSAIYQWADQVADAVANLSGLDSKLRNRSRADLAYRALYSQVIATLADLELQLRSPPHEAIRLALAAYWNADDDSWAPADMERMRRAWVAGMAALVSHVDTVRLDRGIREFSFREVEAAVVELRKMCAPGSKSDQRAEAIVHRLLRAVSNSNVR